MRRYQGRFLREALEQSGWNVSETARRIGLARVAPQRPDQGARPHAGRKG